MMECLNSAWLIRMIEQAGPQPSAKMLALYSLLETWLQAPGVRTAVCQAHANNLNLLDACPVLTAHLLTLATVAKLQHPPVVVHQMMILLQGAIAEELRNPGMGALRAAQSAASAVITQAKPSRVTRLNQAIRTSGYAAAGLSTVILAVYFWPNNQPQATHHAQQDAGYELATTSIAPDLLLKAFALRKSMETGICPTPNFFSMPKEQIPVYLEVVHSRLSNNPNIDNQKLANFLSWYEQQRAWECYPKAQIKQRFISRI
ncbi:hypothetical protein SAMN05192560_1868 [Methylobacillus rhizosphaerae]|uniref:Uncharacterized protein n=1 Tax=Methylobacillus rhizosphaerae TaxID=551994 RepID=A0A239AG73_9PROT|nr:hypothetical protein [Methylobacillus rhizosphaerae]SNR94044.1 hypothetical protein SAMN05192560_1868 [Methylobacillus rhizosphaerae]